MGAMWEVSTTISEKIIEKHMSNSNNSIMCTLFEYLKVRNDIRPDSPGNIFNFVPFRAIGYRDF